jgi:uncharacterized membrane protein
MIPELKEIRYIEPAYATNSGRKTQALDVVSTLSIIGLCLVLIGTAFYVFNQKRRGRNVQEAIVKSAVIVILYVLMMLFVTSGIAEPIFRLVE